MYSQYVEFFAHYILNYLKLVSTLIHTFSSSAYGYNTSDPNMVPQGPRFLIQPRSIVVVGKALAATFECVAHGNPQPDYKITKIANNGSQYDITASWDPRYTLTNGKLSIQSPEDIHDAGTYFCTAENEIGRVRSDYLYMSFGSKLY